MRNTAKLGCEKHSKNTDKTGPIRNTAKKGCEKHSKNAAILRVEAPGQQYLGTITPGAVVFRAHE